MGNQVIEKGQYAQARTLRLASLAVIVLTLAPSTALAQFPTLPFYFRPLHDPYPSFAVAVDYGIGLADISQLEYLGARGSIESEKLRGTLSVGSLMPESGDNELAAAGTFAYNLHGPFDVVVVDGQLGVGYFELGDAATGELRQVDIPIGVGVGLHAPLPFDFIANVEPWAGLRGHIRYTELSGTIADFDAWRGGGGLSAGLRLIHPTGLGAHFGVDWLVIRSASIDEWDSEVGIAFGAQLRW